MVQHRPDRSRVSRQLDQWVKKLKCSGSSGIGLETFKEVRVGVDPSPVVRGKQQSLDTIDSEDLKDIIGDETTTDGLITVDLSEDIQVTASFRKGLRHGQCTATFADGEMRSIKGEYSEGRLAGRARIVYRGGQSVDGFFKDGLLHGFARYFDEVGRLTFAGNHRSGVAQGTCWKIIRGGGSVVGEVDQAGLLTGDNITYLYPDYSTALHGTFHKGVMVSTRECLVVSVEEDESGVLVPGLSQLKLTQHRRQLRTVTDFGLQPTLRDPYEAKVYL